jgi:hypothetical protein
MFASALKCQACDKCWKTNGGSKREKSQEVIRFFTRTPESNILSRNPKKLPTQPEITAESQLSWEEAVQVQTPSLK